MLFRPRRRHRVLRGRRQAEDDDTPRAAHNIDANRHATLLVDHYAEDWSTLWWVRADGRARVEQGVPGQVRELLAAKYPQYRTTPVDGPTIVIEVTTWRGWSAS